MAKRIGDSSGTSHLNFQNVIQRAKFAWKWPGHSMNDVSNEHCRHPAIPDVEPQMKRSHDVGNISAQASKFLRIEAAPMPSLVPPVVRTMSLHDLPQELLYWIAHMLLPASPYLPRPYGAGTAHFPIAPSLRAVTNWGASCKQAQALIGTLCQQEDYREFSQLACTTAYEFGAHTQELRAAMVKRFGRDPAGTPAPQRALRFDLHDESGLEFRIGDLEQSGHQLEKLDIQMFLPEYSAQSIKRVANAVQACLELKSISLKLHMPFPDELLDAMQTIPGLCRIELHGQKFSPGLFARLAK